MLHGLRHVFRYSWLLELLTLRQITNHVYRDVLEGALGKAFAALDNMDWEACELLFFPPGFRVLLWYGLLKAIARVSLRVARQACALFGPSLQ